MSFKKSAPATVRKFGDYGVDIFVEMEKHLLKICNIAQQVQTTRLNSMKHDQIFALIIHKADEMTHSEYTVLQLVTMLRIYDILFSYLLISDSDDDIKKMMIEFSNDRISDFLK